MNVRLIKPTAELQEEYLSFYLDWKESNEPIVPWVVSKDPADFAGMIRFLEDNEQGKDLPDGYVRNSTLWLVTETNRIVGAVNIRHELNEKLLESSGHIGYGIRPSERQKGYATALLSLTLQEAKKLGIHKVLVVCDAHNIGSKKTILNNGGIPDQDFIEEDGNVLNRFWFEV
ncbi:GNAT family N-acetyltransferase [Paenibacillus favisporus]|uniref:GNAT family N-acetyltransferase n=1 Tax=Paenibacillus TaxID=44249 RepID=UPI0011AB42B3|nr:MULTISPECIES: GNAT family N-acetyltransferase [Paenibacillus]MEC0178382.1 GNAT family N-acetyltransferase [Paenibacillus favisporus]